VAGRPPVAAEQSAPESPFRLLKQVLTVEQCRTVVDWMVANEKAKEAAHTEPPALPNVRVMPATPQPADAAVENGRSETLPPVSLPFGNWK
jgi:hypothetical protein